MDEMLQGQKHCDTALVGASIGLVDESEAEFKDLWVQLSIVLLELLSRLFLIIDDSREQSHFLDTPDIAKVLTDLSGGFVALLMPT